MKGCGAENTNQPCPIAEDLSQQNHNQMVRGYGPGRLGRSVLQPVFFFVSSMFLTFLCASCYFCYDFYFPQYIRSLRSSMFSYSAAKSNGEWSQPCLVEGKTILFEFHLARSLVSYLARYLVTVRWILFYGYFFRMLYATVNGRLFC